MLFNGYIDESYGPDRNLFTWCCLIARWKDWGEMERQWKLHLKAKNKDLAKAGRPAFSRYHASDCSSRHGEFEGWTHSERDAFVIGLFGIFKRVPTHTCVYDMQLDELCEVFPEWAGDRLEAAYTLNTMFLLYLIGNDFKKHSQGRQPRINLFHDQTASNGKYDPTILRTFNTQINRPDFIYRDYFTKIASMRWQQCIPLQPADLVAFENYKEVQAKMEARRSRKSFEALINMEEFGIHSKTFQKQALIEMRESMIKEGLTIHRN